MGVFPGGWWVLALGAALAGRLEAAEVLHSEIQFDEFNLKATYVSENHFDMRAMGSVYNASPYIIDFIANKQAYPEGFVSISDGYVQLASPSAEWRPLLAHYAGPVAVLIAALLFAALLPLAGLVWLCCAWCRSGRRRRPFDRKYDACLKGLLAILLISLLTLFLFGVVCAFATEQQLEEGAGAAGRGAAAGGRDVITFLNHSRHHADHLLLHNYQTLREYIDKEIAGGGESIARSLYAEAGLGALDQLASLVSQLPALKTDLDRLHSGTALLRYHAEQLNTGLRKVKGKLLHTLANCDQPQCKRLQEKYRINQLDTEIHYSQIPDVTPLLSNLSALASSGVQDELVKAQETLKELPNRSQRLLGQRASTATRLLDHTESELKRLSAEIEAQCAAGIELVQQVVFPAAEQLETLQQQQGHWRRLLTVATACAALLMTVLLSCGLACGVCGARPDAYGAADCCHKGAGAASLMCGTGMIFLLGGVMSLVMASYFILGIATQRFVCDPLTKQEGNRLFADLEVLVDLEGAVFQQHLDPNYTLQNVLSRCHHNQTIYVSLELERKYNLSSLVRSRSSQMSAAVSSPGLSASSPHVSVLGSRARGSLQALAHSGLGQFRYHAVLDALSTSATSLALLPLSEQLQSASRSLGSRSSLGSALHEAADMLAELHRDRAQPLDRQIQELNATANKIRERLNLDTASLETSVLQLLKQCQDAEEYINTKGHDRMQDLTQEFALGLSAAVTQYLDLVERGARQDVGRCEPMSRAYNHTRDHLCRNVLLPVNGFWMSISWCMLLFIPLILTARRLSSLYRTREPYPGPLVEAEYLYDAYADRDNVPLANESKRSTLDIEGKIAEWRSRGGASPSAPPPAADTRLLLDERGGDVTCLLVATPPAPHPHPQLIEDLKTRLDAKDEDNESGIHESDAYKAEKRRGRGAGGGGGGGGAGRAEGGGGAGGSGAARGAAGTSPAPLDAHHARRYHDMAPKHWEEGPPRYLGPTEYERPPPYYYPPPADRQ